MKIDKLFLGMNISAMGLAAQRKRMNAIANNMANSETTKTEEGGPFRRRLVTLASMGAGGFAQSFERAAIDQENGDGDPFGQPGDIPGGVRAVERDDTSPFRMVYDPSHPDADGEGYVKMPNVNVITEMVDMISASRAYEANVTAISAAKSIARDTLEI